nr:nucleotide sugar dehydrogenase [Paenibacillus daejeonensis]
MSLFQALIDRREKMSIIGLGYVGMPLAVAFAKKINVIGYDNNIDKIKLYKSGQDPTNEVGNEEISNTTVEFTSSEQRLKEAKFHIVSVPTPINLDKTPNLAPIENASKVVGRNLTRGSIVVYESTVYPGVTEDICVNILEAESGLKYGVDFKVGYSPERINPGDKINTLASIVKIVSACDNETLDIISNVYKLIIKAGVFQAKSIKVAEAAKVVENSQRDINIAFMNELAMVFDRMGIDTKEVIEAMNTKWNALGFYPGLVGGHCISVDPYYFIYEAEKLGYHSQIVSAGRKINDGMGRFVAESIVKKLIHTNKKVKDSIVVILGLTFKENTPDTRNSKVIDIIKVLDEYGVRPIVVDPIANIHEVKEQYEIELVDLDKIKDADCLVFAVAHNEFIDKDMKFWSKLFKEDLDNSSKVIIDVKSIMEKSDISNEGFSFWRL